MVGEKGREGRWGKGKVGRGRVGRQAGGGRAVASRGQSKGGREGWGGGRWGLRSRQGACPVLHCPCQVPVPKTSQSLVLDPWYVRGEEINAREKEEWWGWGFSRAPRKPR